MEEDDAKGKSYRKGDISRKASHPTEFERRLSAPMHRSDLTEVKITRELPSHAHILLKSTDIREYVDFFMRWQMYEKAHKVELNVFQVVDEDLILELMAMNDMSDKEFMKLNMTSLFKLVSNDNEIYSPQEFSETLRSVLSDLEVLQWENIGAHNHKEFYVQLLIRKRRFLRTFELLEAANPDVVPSLEGQPFGLYAVWHDLIQHSYNQYVVSCLKKKPRYGEYNSIQQYIEVYTIQAESHYAQSREKKKLWQLGTEQGAEIKDTPGPA